MTAQIIDGKAIAENLLNNIKAKIDARIAAGKRAPCLAVVLVGADPASAIYVRKNAKPAKKSAYALFRTSYPPALARQNC